MRLCLSGVKGVDILNGWSFNKVIWKFLIDIRNKASKRKKEKKKDFQKKIRTMFNFSILNCYNIIVVNHKLLQIDAFILMWGREGFF